MGGGGWGDGGMGGWGDGGDGGMGGHWNWWRQLLGLESVTFLN